jgi:hypothetical protein
MWEVTTAISRQETSPSPSTEATPEDTRLFMVVQLVLLTVIILCNGLVLLTIRRSHQLHVMTFYLLGNMAAADGSFGLSFVLRILLGNRFDGYGCVVPNICGVLSVGTSLSLGLVTCVHNFLAVKCSASARHGLTSRTAKLIIAAIWLFWLGMSGASIVTADLTHSAPQCTLTSAYYSGTWMRAFFSILYLHIVPIIALQLWTIILVRSNTRKSQALIRAQIRVVANATRLRLAQRAANITRVLTFVMLLTLLSWGPPLVTATLYLVCPEACGIDDELVAFISPFLLLNNIGNVLVYIIKCTEFREALRKLFRCSNTVTVATTGGENIALGALP